MEIMIQGLLNALYVLSSIIALVGLTRLDNMRNWFTRTIYEVGTVIASVNLIIAIVLSTVQLIMGKL